MISRRGTGAQRPQRLGSKVNQIALGTKVLQGLDFFTFYYIFETKFKFFFITKEAYFMNFGEAMNYIFSHGDDYSKVAIPEKLAEASFLSRGNFDTEIVGYVYSKKENCVYRACIYYRGERYGKLKFSKNMGFDQDDMCESEWHIVDAKKRVEWILGNDPDDEPEELQKSRTDLKKLLDDVEHRRPNMSKIVEAHKRLESLCIGIYDFKEVLSNDIC